jgi:excisionase family DNA binding protein
MKGNLMAGDILTAEDLAARWKVTTGWIYSKVRAGQLPAIPLPGRYVRFRLETIEAFERGALDSGNGRA